MFKFSGKMCIVIKLATNDLYSHRDAKKNNCLPLLCICHIIHQLLLGIKYFYSEDYTHRDLKPQNILVIKWNSKTDLPTVKLADFKLIGIASDLFSIYNTPGYFAPEIEAEMARQTRLKQ